MAFARDPATLAYYERRAGEYDEWYAGTGRFADRERPGWESDVARVVARELVVVDSAPRPDTPREAWQERVLNDGSRHRVFKRFLTAGALAGEIGGEPLLESAWFSAARATC